MNNYEKEVKEALDRWYKGYPAEECYECTHERYWKSNNCENCEEDY